MSMYEASVEKEFTARHAVRRDDGRFEEPHEHRWRVMATFRAEVLQEPMGVVVDFVAAEGALTAITDQLNGMDLNQLGAFGQGGASAERVAELLAAELQARMDTGGKLFRVAVTEAHGCSAAFYPAGRQP